MKSIRPGEESDADAVRCHDGSETASCESRPTSKDEALLGGGSKRDLRVEESYVPRVLREPKSALIQHFETWTTHSMIRHDIDYADVESRSRSFSCGSREQRQLGLDWRSERVNSLE